MEAKRMKVYRILPDVNRFQSLFPEDGAVWETSLLDFDGTPKGATWHPPKVFVLQPNLIRGNFFHLCSGAIVADSVASTALLDLLERSGELLAMPYQTEDLQIVNVTECVNVLDEEQTKWVLGRSTGKRIRIEKYAFKQNRFTETALFKIPETSRSEILTIEGLKDPEDEFKFNVESKGLSGLLFQELWDSVGE
jgi:hypothetical protein